jgi:3-(3-hydroxy-phenyl)propionate hydroxylase
MNHPEPSRHAVVIVGAGPNGVTLANLLGVYGIDTVLIERSKEILPYPRAVGMDDEALRIFQAAGLADAIVADVIQNVPMRMFDAKGTCFADIRPSTREFGWWRRNIFMQQMAERTLRHGLERYPQVQLRLGEEVVEVDQDSGGVRLKIRREDGVEYTMQADYCVAADGGRSTMREKLGVALVGKTLPRKWVVMDVRNAPVDAPYTALNCDPRRPNVCIYLPYNFRRWEFMLFPDENPDVMIQPDTLRRLIAPYVRDPDAVEIVNARTYLHHSRVAERLVIGRVALIGDAAHLSQPWIGQGMNAGLRDAGNLAWKLAGIVRGTLHPAVLQTYDSERHDHAKAMVDLADTFGALLMPTNRLKAWVRDLFFSSMHFFPGIRNYVLQMRFKPMPIYRKGVVVPSDGYPMVGRMFIQPDVEDAAGRRRKLDDALGPWFAIVGWQVDPQAALSPADREFWHTLGARFIHVTRSRSGQSRESRVDSSHGSACVEDVDNYLANWFEANPGAIVVLRPDRYIAAHTSQDGMASVTQEFRRFAAPIKETSCTSNNASIPSSLAA